MQVNNWQKKISIEEKLDIIHQREKGEQIADIYHNVNLLIEYVQFTIMLIELQELLSQEPKCLCS
jgi:hypothetical protein